MSSTKIENFTALVAAFLTSARDLPMVRAVASLALAFAGLVSGSRALMMTLLPVPLLNQPSSVHCYHIALNGSQPNVLGEGPKNSFNRTAGARIHR
jgi:hypothetical protein